MEKGLMNEGITRAGFGATMDIPFRGDRDMTMSKDRVTFFLPCRYFQEGHKRGTNGFRKDTMKGVLLKSFGMEFSESELIMKAHPHGFNIVCRPSQFARFIVHRCDADEGINGVRDLNPKLGPNKPYDPYEATACFLNLDVNLVRSVATSLGFKYPVCDHVSDTIRVDDRSDHR